MGRREAQDVVVKPKEEAINNMRMAIERLYRVWEETQSEEVNEAIADLEQAVRFLTGEEIPS